MTAPAATPANMRALHSHVVDAILGQQPDNLDALLALMGGLRMGDLIRALDTGFARIRSAIEDDTLKYLVEVMSDIGWVVLTRPPAFALGIDDTPELRDEEIAVHVAHMFRDLGVDGDDQ